MADSKSPAPASRPVEAASAAPGEKRAAARPPLAKASESGDPAVQKVLADKQTAQMNAAMHEDEVRRAQAARTAHERQAAAAEDALREMGYE